MKEAMWGVGLITVSLFGIFLVNIFGNLTVTNQQDYTAMTNTVEAAMNDARDVTHYRTGFCVCTSKAKVNGKWIFNSSSDYEIVDPVNNKCPTVSYKTCELIEGEYKIDKKIFAESLTRRFSQSVKANNDYQIIVQDVIEYPPKVSVLVKAKSEENYAAVGGEFIITNQIDSILESSTDFVPLIDATPIPTPTPKPTPKPVATAKPSSSVSTTTNNSSYVRRTPVNTPSTSGCFLAGVKVFTNDGYKNIEKIKNGDYVLTYNEELDINEFKKVVNAFRFDDLNEELYSIKTDDTVLYLTGHHGVFTKRGDKYSYIAAMELGVGDVVKYSDGKYHKIEDISHYKINDTVYNLEVEDNHNFYVGDKKILVHNMQVKQECRDKTGDTSKCGGIR